MPVSTLVGTSLAFLASGYVFFRIYAEITGIGRARAALGRIARSGGNFTPVSVLKPLCGDEPGLYENLRSFCVQSHADFQLVFGVREASDPAAAVVRRLQAEFPGREIDLVVNPAVHGANLKVSNLVNMLEFARHDWLVLADSDIRVRPDYLVRVTAPLADPGVGVVTCLYRGVPRGGLWAHFGVLFIDEWFAPSVRVAHALGSTRFAFGATLALRRSALRAAGSFDALNDILADDFWLAEYTRQQGLRTVLSDVVVTTDVTDRRCPGCGRTNCGGLRTIHAVAPVGFAFTCVTFTFPMLLAGWALARTDLCLLIAVAGMAGRLAFTAGTAASARSACRNTSCCCCRCGMDFPSCSGLRPGPGPTSAGATRSLMSGSPGDSPLCPPVGRGGAARPDRHGRRLRPPRGPSTRRSNWPTARGPSPRRAS